MRKPKTPTKRAAIGNQQIENRRKNEKRITKNYEILKKAAAK